jgi:DNA ligase D-like protein (predicted 3'-phosphoesterase)
MMSPLARPFLSTASQFWLSVLVPLRGKFERVAPAGERGSDHDADAALSRYRAKRSFDRTPEPSGEPLAAVAGTGRDANPRFVVQKHDARRLHYDFRLEAGGVLVSWAVPKGPSYDPGAKRLAVHVEDHPLDYEEFEGVIPEAQYGAGTVIVWDRGTYRNLTEKRGNPLTVEEAVRAGHVSIWLEGAKLKGGWSLTRTRGYGDGDNWLLIKKADEHADAGKDVTAEEPLSVKSGRDLNETAGDRSSATWTRERATWAAPVVEDAPPGIRCVAVRNGDEVVLWSADHERMTERFGSVARALCRLPADNFTLDGVVTASGDYVAVDLLHLLGHDTTVLPPEERRSLLARTVQDAGGLVRVSG